MSKGTKQRNIRIEDAIWGPAADRAKSEGTDVSTVVRDFLERYGERVDKPAR